MQTAFCATLGHKPKGAAMPVTPINLAVTNITPTSARFGWELTPLIVLIRSLFGAGEQGAFYIPRPTVNGAQVLFQDSAGTVPVAADGDPVGRMLDQSGNGNHAIQSASGRRPVYRTDGTLYWLEFDGTNTSMVFNALPVNFTAFFGLATALKSSDDVIISNGISAVEGRHFGYNDGTEIRTYNMLSAHSLTQSIVGILSSNEKHVLTFGLQSTTYTRVNGSTLRSDAQTVLSNNNIQYIGGFNRSSPQSLEGNLYSAIFVGGNQYSVSDVEKAEQYTADQSGVTL